jgi:excisionase family DNA binding protein
VGAEARGVGLTPADVAERLGLSPNAVYQLLNSGKLSSYRVGPGGGRHRISEAHFQAYLDSCEGGPKGAGKGAGALSASPPGSPPAYGCRGRAERLDGKPLKHY